MISVNLKFLIFNLHLLKIFLFDQQKFLNLQAYFMNPFHEFTFIFDLLFQ